MKKKISTISRVLAIVLMFAMILPVNAASADTTFETDHMPISGGGVNYEMWTCLYQDTATNFRGCSWVCNKTYQNLPAGYMGVSNYLCHPNGIMYTAEDMTYNYGGIYFHYNGTGTATADFGGIYSGGEIAVYNGSGYNRQPAPSTVVRYPSITASFSANTDLTEIGELAQSLEDDGNYPITSSGETYGSVLLADYVGIGPDLILAEGVDGTTGYVLASDLRQNVNNPDEARKYMAGLETNENEYRTIPLYDLNKNVIGSFNVQIPDLHEEIPEEIQATIDQLNIKRELPRNSKGESYGTKLMENNYGIDLDLLAAKGTKGQDGYIRKSDTVEGKWGAIINTPEEAMKYMEYLNKQPEKYLIPLYDSEGNVIGEFLYGGNSNFSTEEISAQVGVDRK